MTRTNLLLGLLGVTAVACTDPTSEEADEAPREDELRAQAGTVFETRSGVRLELSMSPSSHPVKDKGPVRLDVSRGETRVTLGCTITIRMDRARALREIEVSCENEEVIGTYLDIALRWTSESGPTYRIAPPSASQPHWELWSDLDVGKDPYASLRLVERSKAPEKDVLSFSEHVIGALEPLFEKKIQLTRDESPQPVRHIAFMLGSYKTRCGDGWISSIDPFMDSLDTTKDVCVFEKAAVVAPEIFRTRFEKALEGPR